MAQLITFLGHDIYTQVTARDGWRRASVQLSDRFQITIDRSAVNAGKETTDEYLAEKNCPTRKCCLDLAAKADQKPAALEKRSTWEVLQSYVHTGGFKPVDEQESESV